MFEIKVPSKIYYGGNLQQFGLKQVIDQPVKLKNFLNNFTNSQNKLQL